jgi:hypothetical protein
MRMCKLTGVLHTLLMDCGYSHAVVAERPRFTYHEMYIWGNSQKQSFAIADGIIATTQFMVKKGMGGAADRQTACLTTYQVSYSKEYNNATWPTPYNEVNTIVADSSTRRPPVTTDIVIDSTYKTYAADNSNAVHLRC